MYRLSTTQSNYVERAIAKDKRQMQCIIKFKIVSAVTLGIGNNVIKITLKVSTISNTALSCFNRKLANRNSML